MSRSILSYLLSFRFESKKTETKDRENKRKREEMGKKRRQQILLTLIRRKLSR
jgi:hypothetical protein